MAFSQQDIMSITSFQKQSLSSNRRKEIRQKETRRKEGNIASRAD